MFNTMEINQALELEDAQLAGMLGARGTEQFSQMGKDQVYQAFKAMDYDQALGMGGDSLAGMFGTLDPSQIDAFSDDQFFDAFSQIEGSHFEFMDSDSAFAMFDHVGFDQALELSGDQLAGLLGAMEGYQFDDMSFKQVTSAFDRMAGDDFRYLDPESATTLFEALGYESVLDLQGDQVAGIMGALDAAQVGQLDSGQLFNALLSMDEPETFAYLSPGSALAMYKGIVFDPANDMDAMRAAGLFGAMDPVDITRGAILQLTRYGQSSIT